MARDGSDAAPGPDEVRRIAAIASPVLRNLEITECYSRLAAAMAARTKEGANWCTYATWASRQAGRTIRGEDLFAEVGRRLDRRGSLLHPVASLWRSLLRRGLLRPDSRLGRLTAQLHTPFDAVELASAAVARGNAKVFEEIGLEFARYLDECPPDRPPGSSELKEFLAGLHPGEPPDGQRYLRQAFARYDRLRVVDDPKARVELLVLANLEIGLHEQTRLQPEIRQALDAPHATSEDLGRRVLVALFPGDGRPARRPRPPRSSGPRAGRGRRAARCEPSRARRGHRLVHGAVAADARAGAGHAPRRSVPGRLREPADPELAELLGRFEPAPPALDDCGARDWSELPQRMHYISHLFRAFHSDAGLFDPPFTPEQVTSFGRGLVPDGDL